MPLKLRPLSNRVVVDVDTPAALSEYGIHVPPSAQEKPQVGDVVAVGPGKVSEFPVLHHSEVKSRSVQAADFGADFKRLPMKVKEGDRVLFGKYSGTEISIGRDKFLVLRETDILCLLEGGEDGDFIEG